MSPLCAKSSVRELVIGIVKIKQRINIKLMTIFNNLKLKIHVFRMIIFPTRCLGTFRDKLPFFSSMGFTLYNITRLF